MAFIEINYSTAFTFTFVTPLTGLVEGGIALTGTEDNTLTTPSTFFISEDIQLKLKTGASVVPDGFVTVYLLRSVDGGTTFDSEGSFGELTPYVLDRFDANVASTTYVQSIDTSVHGTLPSFYRIAVKNNTGGTLSSTASDHHLLFRGKKFEIQP
jgi:hypothetical protein